MEETEGKLNELGQRISAIEKAQLQSLELIQGEPLTKDKIEELKKSREEQVKFETCAYLLIFSILIKEYLYNHIHCW